MACLRRHRSRHAGNMLVLFAVGGLIAAPAVPTHAEGDGGGQYGFEITISNARFSQSATRSIETAISDAGRQCGRLAREYRIDCLSSSFTRIAEDVPASTDYREVRTELYRTWRKLRVIVRANQDPSAPRSTPAGRNVPSGGYTAVSQGNLEAASRAAAAVIREAETKLLRSGETSDRRRSHYRSIAGAVGSTTRILRS